MRFEDLRDMHLKRPFVAFGLNLADGRVLPVRHPEVLAYPHEGARTIVYVHDDARVEKVDVMLVVSAEELPPRKGRGRRKSA